LSINKDVIFLVVNFRNYILIFKRIVIVKIDFIDLEINLFAIFYHYLVISFRQIFIHQKTI
jgi:hypothetical protein